MNLKTNLKNLRNYRTYLKVEEAVVEFLKTNNYLKIDLPILSPSLIPESYLEVFKTEFKYLGHTEPLYLTPSPELFLKRLLAYGSGDCYYLGKAFRNADPAAPLHAFEFTMLEFYRLNAGYMDIAGDLLKMLRFISERIYKKEEISFNGKTVSFNKWEKITVAEAFNKFAGIKNIFDEDNFIKDAEKKNYRTTGFTYEDLFSQIYSQEVEPNLGQSGYPTLIYDYPKKFAALAKLKSDGKTAERFEFYIVGIELGDCYTELTDWKEQEDRFMDEEKKRRESGKITHPVDKGFIEALKYGLKPCAGIAIGFERLALIFADVKSIWDLKLIKIS